MIAHHFYFQRGWRVCIISILLLHFKIRKALFGIFFALPRFENSKLRINNFILRALYNITWCSRNGFERRILKNSIQIILHRLKDPLVRMRIHYFLHQLLFPKIIFYEGSMYRSIQYLFNLIDFYSLVGFLFVVHINMKNIAHNKTQ